MFRKVKNKVTKLMKTGVPVLMTMPMIMPMIIFVLATPATTEAAEPERQFENHVRNAVEIVLGKNNAKQVSGQKDALAGAPTSLANIQNLSGNHPTSNLMQLLMGDWLMVQANNEVLLSYPSALRKWRVAGLRNEAAQRLSYQSLPQAYLPASILQLSDKHKHVLMLDAARSRLYVFENRDGEPHLIADYYASVGKAGIGKRKRGDNKSPIGIYSIERWRTDDALDELYGAGAYELSYPNNWDKRQGRTGSGIWIHGTPRVFNSRPPEASRGCVVINNDVLKSIRKKIGKPSIVVLTPRSRWVPAEDWRLMRDAVRARVEQWRHDWESGNINRYLSHYAEEYKDDKRSYAAMIKATRRNAKKKTWLKVGIQNIDLFAYPEDKQQVFAVFDQNYRSNNYNVRYRKQQMWREKDGRLALVYEGRWAD